MRHSPMASARGASLSFFSPISSLKWSESHSVMSDSLWPHGLYSPWNSPGWNTAACSLSLLQGIFPTQGLNLGVPHRGRILYQLSHKGSPISSLLKVYLALLTGLNIRSGVVLNILRTASLPPRNSNCVWSDICEHSSLPYATRSAEGTRPRTWDATYLI